MQIILNHRQTQQKITRLGHELIENCFEENTKYIRGKGFRHPYVTWLEECGFSCVVYRTPIKTRAASGYLVAKRIL